MIILRMMRALLCALALFPPAATFAHDNPSAFETTHWRCLDIPQLERYRQISFTNQRLQRTTPRLSASDEQPLGLCVSNAHKGGKFVGFVMVREMRRPSGSGWVGFNLTDWWDWWQVTKRLGATASASMRSSVEDTIEPMRAPIQ